MKQAQVRILVVDDSEIFTTLLGEAIAADGRTEVAGVAHTGVEAIRMARELKPDVISMDVYMPEMGGLDAVTHIMDETPTPILMVTAATSEEMSHISFQAVAGGALDVLAKPAGPADAAAIVKRLRLMAGVRVRRRPTKAESKTRRTVTLPTPVTRAVPAATAMPLWKPGRPLRRVDVVAIAISTGGPPVLERVLKGLGSDWSSTLLIAQHISPRFGPHLVDWLRGSSSIGVELATEGRMRPSTAYIAPSNRHLAVRMGGRLEIDGEAERVDGHRPSGTVLLQSVAKAYGARAAGLVLTGMGEDGARGLLTLREAGGLTAAQDGASSAVDGMPKKARDLGAAEHVVTLEDLPAFVRALGTA